MNSPIEFELKSGAVADPATAAKTAMPSAPPVCRAVLLAPEARPGVPGVAFSAAATIAGVRTPRPVPHRARKSAAPLTPSDTDTEKTSVREESSP